MSSPPALPAPASAAAQAAVHAAIAKSKAAVSSTESSSTVAGASGAESDSAAVETLSAGLLDPRDNITVFNDPNNFNVKHPLFSSWVLWFDSASKSDKGQSSPRSLRAPD